MRAFWTFVVLAAVLIAGYFGYKALHNPSPEKITVAATAKELKYFEALRSEKFILAGQAKLDIDALIALLPEKAAITYAKAAFDPDSGATRLDDLKITAADNSDIGLHIGQLSLWGVDYNAISDRASGRRLDETIPVATRVEIDGLKMFGMETILEVISDASKEITVDIVEDLSNDGDLETELSEELLFQSFDRLDFSIGRSVITDVTVHPWVLELTDLKIKDEKSKEGLTKIWHIVQKLSAWNYSLSYENYVSYDIAFNIDMKMEDMPYSMALSYDLMGHRDIDRGNTGFGIVKGSRNVSDMTLPKISSDGESLTNIRMKTESFTEFYTMKDVNMSGLSRHIAQGKFPGRDETDLMSFGIFRSGPSWSKFNDIDIFSVDSAYFDMSEFHWLIPEKIELGVNDMKFNIEGLVDYYMTLLSMPSEDLEFTITDDQKQIAADSIKILEKYDLAVPEIDFAMDVHWDAETGLSDFGYKYDIDQFFAYDVKAEMDLPDYVTAMATIPEDLETFDKEAFAEMFMEEIAFKKYRVFAEDKGGLEKGFAMAVDFAQLAPEDEPGVAMLRNTTPEILRNMATNAFIVPMSEVSKVFPPGVAYLQSVSDFIGKGGSLEIIVAPPQPLDMSDFEALAETVKSNPSAIVEVLGMSVVHTDVP
ncbi:MAG: hypothetical protein HKO02_08790 [Hyphomonadaceae bacterium]|nr:hypothetical protein [Hyphomonadaceae bacterium]